ncbi:MAG: hypothetical protein ACI93V_000922 [Alteromonadaceae bacterium]|jgi:hypothetical protein
MRNKRITSSLQRKRQLARRYHKVATRRQEFFIQTLNEERSAD